MKFWAPKTLAEAFAPMIPIKWVFGIGVIEYPMGRPRRTISVFLSIVNFLIYLVFLKMANISEAVRLQGFHLDANNYRITAYLCVVFVATSLCLAQIRAKLVGENLSKLNGMNDTLSILGVPNDYELLFKAQIIQLTAAFAWMIVIMVLNFKYAGYDFPSVSSRIGFLMVYHYFLIFAFVVDFIVNVSIRYVGNRFRRLNELLAESYAPEESGTMVNQKSDKLIPHYPSMINEIHRSNSRAMRAANQRWLLYVIRETRKIHRGLCKTALELNKAFGIQVLFSVALSFGQIISLLYTCYIILTILPPGGSINDWLPLLGPFLWVVFNAIKIFLIVEACATTSCEAKRTGGLISKLLDTASNDGDIRDEINIFSLELMQNPLNFTACGFFALDYPLIRAIIGSVTTYLVIMIQMQGIYESENVNSMPNSTIY